MGEHPSRARAAYDYSERVRTASALVLGALLWLALVACGGTSDESVTPQAQPQPPPVVESGSASDSRERAPAIAGQSLDGDAITLGDFRGKPVLVNVWSSW